MFVYKVQIIHDEICVKYGTYHHRQVFLERQVEEIILKEDLKGINEDEARDFNNRDF